MATDENSTVLEPDYPLGVPFKPVFDIWLEKRGEKWAPPLSQFRLEDLPLPILPWSVLVDVGIGERAFSYRFWGSERCTLIGLELTGKTLADIPDPVMREGNFAEYNAIRCLKLPMLCKTPVRTATGHSAEFESMRLPISNDGENVTQIFSALNYMELGHKHYDVFGTAKGNWL